MHYSISYLIVKKNHISGYVLRLKFWNVQAEEPGKFLSTIYMWFALLQACKGPLVLRIIGTSLR